MIDYEALEKRLPGLGLVTYASDLISEEEYDELISFEFLAHQLYAQMMGWA